MAIQDSMRVAMEQRLQWLKNYVATIRASVEELPAHDQEIADIEAALKAADDHGEMTTVAVAARPKPAVDSADNVSQENASVEESPADSESAKPAVGTAGT